MIVTPILDHGIVLGRPAPGYVRTEGLHASQIYNDLYAALDPKKYGGESLFNQSTTMELGLALEEGLERPLKDRLGAQRPGEFTTPDGIIYTPDFLAFRDVTRLGEIKLTWMSSKGVPRVKANGFPPKFDKWLCVAPYTRILTYDLRWTYAGDLKAGDKLIGFDEHGHPKRWIRPTTVQHVRTITKPSARLVLEDNTELECSLDHRWFIKTGAGQGRWERTDQLLASDQRIGAPRKRNFALSRICPARWEPTALDEYSTGWLAGIFDGEGSLGKYGDGATKLVVAQNRGPVLSRIHKLLRDDGYKTFISEQHGCVSTHLATQADIWRFLAQVRPLRLLKTFGALPEIGGFSYDRVRVAERHVLGDRPVVAVETDTKTYIAEGFASHNCQMKFYCYELETPYATLVSYFVNGPGNYHGPELLVWDIEFTARELQENQQMLRNHARHRGWLT